MKSCISILSSLLAVCMAFSSCCRDEQPGPVKVIFETDMGNDIDDALALDMLYKYMDAGKVDLLAVCVNKEGYGPVEYVDMMNTWYGYPHIPVGAISDGIDCNYPNSNYAAKVAAAGQFRTSIPDYSSLIESPVLYRKILAGQPDHSVTIVSVGFSTNLVRLMETGPDEFSDLTGLELVAKKVKMLSVMAGDFREGAAPEFNVVKDIPSAKLILEQWPSPVVVSPFDVGISICYPATSIENDFGWTDLHPMVEGYKAWGKMPYDRPTWDLTSVLYAVEGDSWFTVSPFGKMRVEEDGRTLFEPCDGGDRRFLSVTPAQADSILARFLEIVPSVPRSKVPVVWHDASEFPVYGKVSEDTEGRYGRLPASLKDVCREPVWYLGQNSAGVYVRFRARTPRMHIKWTSLFDNTMNHMTDTGTKGVDLYALTDGQWRYVGSGRPVGKYNSTSLICGDQEREYMIYLSLYDGVESMQIGIDEGGFISVPVSDTPCCERPVIIYGTSIGQGGCANRPGMAHTNILSRWLDRQVINLGFSGNALLDYEIAELMASCKNPGAFVLDNAPNCTPELIDVKGEKFFRILRDAHPDVPVIFVESPYLPTPFDTYDYDFRARKNMSQRHLYEKLCKAGEKSIYYIKSDDIMGHDGEATVDGVHFTDMGMVRYAEHVFPTIRNALKRAGL